METPAKNSIVPTSKFHTCGLYVVIVILVWMVYALLWSCEPTQPPTNTEKAWNREQQFQRDLRREVIRRHPDYRGD